MRFMEKEEIRQALAQEAARLAAMRDDVRSADELDSDERSGSGGEINSADQHPADLATETQYREIDLSLLEQIESELLDVEHALQKLSNGTYGKCDVCSEDIGEERLKELPATPLCINHAQSREAATAPHV
jgi:RNA polymerase-binding transcription factor DksA